MLQKIANWIVDHRRVLVIIMTILTIGCTVLLPDQRLIFPLAELLDVEKIGISLTENGAMYPQSSVCGLYLASPHARYFVIE